MQELVLLVGHKVAVGLDVLAQRAGVRVALVAAGHLAVVGFVHQRGEIQTWDRFAASPVAAVVIEVSWWVFVTSFATS